MPSPTRDWSAASYSRVYATLAIDHPLIWDDDRLLAWWLRLLRGADDAYPGPAAIPRGLPDDVLDALMGSRIVEPYGAGGYIFRGLESERAGRASRGRKGGLQRAASAERTPLGRFAGADAGEMSSDAGPDAGADAGPASAPRSLAPAPPASMHQRAADQRAQRDETRQDEEPLESALRLGSPPAPEPALVGRGAPTEGTIRCNEYHNHQRQHRLIPGVGWKCPVCEAEWAREDSESFDEKVRKYGDPF